MDTQCDAMIVTKHGKQTSECLEKGQKVFKRLETHKQKEKVIHYRQCTKSRENGSKYCAVHAKDEATVVKRIDVFEEVKREETKSTKGSKIRIKKSTLIRSQMEKYMKELMLEITVLTITTKEGITYVYNKETNQVFVPISTKEAYRNSLGVLWNVKDDKDAPFEENGISKIIAKEQTYKGRVFQVCQLTKRCYREKDNTWTYYGNMVEKEGICKIKKTKQK